MIDFNEKFKEYNNFQLYEIIAKPNDYQLKAVEVAKSLFESRKIASEEVDQLKEQFDAKQSLKLEMEQKAVKVENKIKGLTDSVILSFNPAKRKHRTADQTIIIISIIYTASYLWDLFKSYKVLLLILSDFNSFGFATSFVSLFPYIVIPFMIILFFAHKKLGWRLLSISLMMAVIALVSGMFVELTSPRSINPNGITVHTICMLIFNGGVLWVICRENIRLIFRVSTRDILYSVVFSLILMTSLLLFMFI